MYACILEIGCGFFEGVSRLENRPLTFRDPPPPHLLWSSYVINPMLLTLPPTPATLDCIEFLSYLAPRIRRGAADSVAHRTTDKRT